MFRVKSAKVIMVLVVMFSIGLLGALVTQAASNDVTSSGAANPAVQPQVRSDNNPVDVNSPESARWVNCTADNVAVYSERIHVQCKESYSGIRYFAYSTSNATSVARFLSVLTSGQVSGHLLKILYDPADHSGTAYGCNANDCRPIIAVALY